MRARPLTFLLLVAVASGQPAKRDYAGEPRGDFESRRRETLELAVAPNRRGLDAQLARLALGRGPLDQAALQRSLDKIRRRDDTADFDAVLLLRLLGQGGPLLTAELQREIRTVLIGFKYWVDEPGRDLLSMWSENHQIGYHTAEYLAGQFFPDELFPNHHRSGRQHRDAARERIQRWIGIKARVGFSEWDSNSYYPVTMSALLALAELADEPEIARRAAMLLDVMFFDMAVDSFRGTYGTSHGRTYTGTLVAGGRGEGTGSLQ